MPPPGRLYDALTVVYTAAQVIQRAAVIGVEKKLPSAAYGATSRPRNDPKTAQVRSNPVTEDIEPIKDTSATKPSYTIKPNTWTYVQPNGINPPAMQNSTLDPVSQSAVPSAPELPLSSEPLSSVESDQAKVDSFDYYEDSEVRNWTSL
jgi:hypothetical protein